MLSRTVSEGVKISVDCIDEGPAVVQSHTDEVDAAVSVIRQGVRAGHEGYDAVVVYCFSDVAVPALREHVSIPVIGPGEVSLAVASMISNRFLVITTTEANIPRTYRRLMANPIAREKMVSVRSLEISVQGLRDCPQKTVGSLRDVIRGYRKEDSFDTVVLGCLGMAEYGDPLMKELDVRIIDPAFVALAYAEMAVRLNLRG
ncbi:MAG: hypothetical protein GXY18_10670 [Methanomicrobiales archaeon]|nr:hypothetical protein [Methanomicrobiales archaeon]